MIDETQITVLGDNEAVRQLDRLRSWILFDGDHFAFITGKSILKSVIIANKCIEECRREQKKGWMVKLDLEKAYNKTDWEFLTLFWLERDSEPSGESGFMDVSL